MERVVCHAILELQYRQTSASLFFFPCISFLVPFSSHSIPLYLFLGSFWEITLMFLVAEQPVQEKDNTQR